MSGFWNHYTACAAGNYGKTDMMTLRALEFGLSRRLPVLLQTEASECSLACLAMVASYHGYETDLAEMRKKFPVSLMGATLTQIAEFADKLGMTSRALQLELFELAQLQLPAIAHWDLNHFVTLKAVVGDWVYIHDPACGELKLSMKAVSEHFTGIALELEPSLNFKRKAAPAPIELKTLFGRVTGLKRGVAQLLSLALIVEVLSLVTPILTQWVTDEAIVSGDRNLLSALCFGIVAIGLSTALIEAVRSYIGIYISARFNLGIPVHRDHRFRSIVTGHSGAS